MEHGTITTLAHKDTAPMEDETFNKAADLFFAILHQAYDDIREYVDYVRKHPEIAGAQGAARHVPDYYDFLVRRKEYFRSLEFFLEPYARLRRTGNTPEVFRSYADYYLSFLDLEEGHAITAIRKAVIKIAEEMGDHQLRNQVERIDMSEGLYVALKRNGIDTVRQLLMLNVKLKNGNYYIPNTRAFGKTTIRELKMILADADHAMVQRRTKDIEREITEEEGAAE